MNLTFASIADDDTGASDIAGMLASQRMRTLVILDSATSQEIQQWAQDADALVFAIASRALPPQEAYRKSREACQLILPLKPRTVAVKYCSTFDSTPEGNIGPSIDAAMDALGQPFTVAVPALPINGRTTYVGHHFVGTQLLSESSMRNHPLNPMTNSNLVSHLQSQTGRKVGLAAHPAVRSGALSLRHELKALQESGVEIAVIDCICDSDLEVISEVIADMPLITGSSGYAVTLAAAWRRRGFWSEGQQSRSITSADTRVGTLIISGSCSEATRVQSKYFEHTGVHSYVLEGTELASEVFDRTNLVAEAVALLKSGKDVFIRTNAKSVHAVHQWALAQGSNPISVGMKISAGLGAIARDIVSHVLPQGIVVAGGETSGTICRTIGIKALRIGRNIVPGVPLCASITTPIMPVVLKSGNFGGEDFFLQAREAIRSCPKPEEQPR
ncbi:MAG TPA: 3-oxo-tetronate kinase [Terriglobales bacterium]|nr:3-oxo-tetronate kinase [Terriglobales bacterium]